MEVRSISKKGGIWILSARTEVRYHFNLTQTVSEKNDLRVSLKTNQTNKQNKTNKNNKPPKKRKNLHLVYMHVGN